MKDDNDLSTVDMLPESTADQEKCIWCHEPLRYSGTGRIPQYCSNGCRQAAYRLRKNGYEMKRPVYKTLRNLAGTVLDPRTKVCF
jgi:hypothetical protein